MITFALIVAGAGLAAALIAMGTPFWVAVAIGYVLAGGVIVGLKGRAR